MSIQTQIIHGDATQELSILPDQCADLIITDVPYLVAYRDRQGRTVANDDSPSAVLSAFPEMARVLKNDSYCILFCGWVALPQFSAAWENAGLRCVGQIVYHKSYASRVWHTDCRHEMAFLLAKGRPAKPEAPVPCVMDWTDTSYIWHPTVKAISILTPLFKDEQHQRVIELARRVSRAARVQRSAEIGRLAGGNRGGLRKPRFQSRP